MHDEPFTNVTIHFARQQCADMRRRLESIQEMLDVIPQANAKGYAEIVKDHASRISMRLELLQDTLKCVHASVSKFA